MVHGIRVGSVWWWNSIVHPPPLRTSHTVQVRVWSIMDALQVSLLFYPYLVYFFVNHNKQFEEHYVYQHDIVKCIAVQSLCTSYTTLSILKLTSVLFRGTVSMSGSQREGVGKRYQTSLKCLVQSKFCLIPPPSGSKRSLRIEVSIAFQIEQAVE